MKFQEIKDKWMQADKELLQVWDNRFNGFGPLPGIEESLRVQTIRAEYAMGALSLTLEQLIANENNTKSV